MRTFVIIFLIFVIFTIKAQESVRPGIYRYNYYIDNIYVGYDTLIYDKIPFALREYYYGKDSFRIEIIKKTYLEKDTTYNKSNLHIRTKQAKDGYLFVNKIIMDKIKDSGFDKCKVSYVYNNRVITTEEDVIRLLGLRKKRIQITDILQDEQSITVYIIDK